MSAIAASCPNCQTALPPDARFCAGCGRRVGEDPAEIAWAVADRRTFGVLPGRSKIRAARIRAVRLLGVVRAQTVLVVEILRAHVQAQRDRYRLHRRAAALSRERSHALQGLGEAALYGDRQDVKRAKAEVTGLDAELQIVSEELERVEGRLEARVEAVQRDEGATRAVEPVPQPEPVPEPSPVPSDPPGPVVVPEPEPVPHEPPGPVIVPEPQPRTRAARRR
jgi:zinc ribbon protein